MTKSPTTPPKTPPQDLPKSVANPGRPRWDRSRDDDSEAALKKRLARRRAYYAARRPDGPGHDVLPDVRPVPDPHDLRSILEAHAEALVRARRVKDGRDPDAYRSAEEERLIDRATRRARRLADLQDAMSGTRHLGHEVRRRLRAIPRRFRLAGPATVHAADELAAGLLEEMDWMRVPLEAIWQDARASAAAGRGLHVRPILLVGPPGIGKTHLARSLAERAGVPFASIDLGAGSEGFAIAGNSRGWGSSMMGRPLETILGSGIANPVVLVDEVEKGHGAFSTRGHFTSAHNALLPLLEPSTAARFVCPYLDTRADLSRVSWLLCANALGGIPAPLLSRVRVFHLGPLGREDLIRFAGQEARRRGLSAAAHLDFAAALARMPRPLPDLRWVLRTVEGLARIETSEAWQ